VAGGFDGGSPRDAESAIRADPVEPFRSADEVTDPPSTVTGTGPSLLGRRPDAGDPIRIGFQIWGQHATWAELMTAGERVEAAGFASLFANDHLMPIHGDASGPVLGAQGPVFEGWMTLGAWAARTTQIPLGVLVCGVGYRNVGLTVKMATALDHASGGRSMLGIGAGWHEPETRAFGYEVLPLGDRISRFDEASALARGLLDGGTVTQDGRWIRTEEARNDPPPLQRRMPLLIGGSGEKRMLRIVARDADIWNGEGDPATYARKNAILDERCAEIGREPAEIRRTVGVAPVCIRDTREAAVAALAAILVRHGGDRRQAREWAESSPLADTEEVVARQFRAWRDAGAEEAVIDLPAQIDDETFERLAGPVRERLA
jgi:alkanesulfonate monooxygenase SsuD/methylene tetrahydromethanopterin reductase-like flavin-dependent oxidoreductase (luciferase family)